MPYSGPSAQTTIWRQTRTGTKGQPANFFLFFPFCWCNMAANRRTQPFLFFSRGFDTLLLFPAPTLSPFQHQQGHPLFVSILTLGPPFVHPCFSARREDKSLLSPFHLCFDAKGEDKSLSSFISISAPEGMCPPFVCLCFKEGGLPHPRPLFWCQEEGFTLLSSHSSPFQQPGGEGKPCLLPHSPPFWC